MSPSKYKRETLSRGENRGGRGPHGPDVNEVPMTTDIVIVLTTIPDRPLDNGASSEPVGDVLARALVEEGLAACVNVLPSMISTYRWKGAIERDVERQVVIKTTRDRVPAIQARLGELHPYALPEFLVVSIAGGGEAYLNWIRRG